MIKTSVIIPVYNTSIYIEECVDSVFRQTQKEIEVIAINDGSTDDSLEILLCLQKKYPELIIISQENNGLGYTRNVGINRARGEYIYFLDSDDYILENTLERCYECASKNKLDLVLFDAYEFEESIDRKPIEPNYSDRHEVIKERDEVFSGSYFLEKYHQVAYTPEACFMYCSKVFLKKHDIHFLTGVFFEDNEFYCRVMTMAERVMYIPEMFYRYRCRKNSITGEYFDLRRARDHIEVINAMANLKNLRDCEGWHAVKKICLNLLGYVADVCAKNELYDKDNQLSEQILNTWVKISGNMIENTVSLEDIEYVSKLCKYIPNLDFNKRKVAIDTKREQLLMETIRSLPFNKKESKVAVYGCGKYTEKVLDYYEKWVGSIEADVIFLDSYIKDCDTTYRGYPLYPVKEIGEKQLDNILISSPQYEQEMGDTIRKLYGNKFVVVSLYGDLHINI